jgi:hypothetical protein
LSTDLVGHRIRVLGDTDRELFDGDRVDATKSDGG